ncbi:MAG TPA: hypothetical protein VI248_29975, partial [Kineosporiaceae bacterium]
MRTTGEGSYSAVLRLQHSRRIFAAALLGRAAFALIPLSSVFAIQERTGSFAVAGGAVAAYGLTTVTLPLKSRLID